MKTLHSATDRRPSPLGRSVVACLLCCLGLLCALPAAAAAQDSAPEIITAATGTTEIGMLSGTSYRIDVPANWNHSLVVYFHGYQEGVTTYHLGVPLNSQVAPIFERGYAVIQSAYSTPGWALAEAYPETEQLRQYFIKHYAKPIAGRSAKALETYVAGGSMGGALVVAALELNPKPYAGGLDLCGSVGPTDLAFQRRFAWRAAFDFYFPGVMPPLDPVPVGFEETSSLKRKAEAAMKANPASAAALRNLTGLHTDHEVAEAMTYFTYVIADIQRRAAGNAFDNRNFLYTGTSPTSSAADNALNDGVRRYAADPRARAYLLRHFTPSGRLARPMLALHNTYDPRIPAWTLTVYAEEVAAAGYADNLVQQFVKRDGHCTFSQDEVGRAFDELVAWVHLGRRPVPGDLPGLPALVPPHSATAQLNPH